MYYDVDRDVELRSVVKFFIALDKPPSETLIKSTGKYEKCIETFVYK